MSLTFDITTGEPIAAYEMPLQPLSRPADRAEVMDGSSLAQQTIDERAPARSVASLPPDLILLEVERFLETQR